MLKRPGRDVSLGVLFFAVMFADFLLGIFVLLGRESMFVSADYRTMADATFDFPCSHGLVSNLGWSLGAFALVWTARKLSGKAAFTAAIVVAVAVFSHFILDALVHVPELPLLGRGSAKVGLSLWKHPVTELTLEMLLLATGLVIYLRTVRLSHARMFALVAAMALVAAFTIVGLLVPMPAPNPRSAAVSWLVTPLLLAVLGVWLEKGSRRATFVSK